MDYSSYPSNLFNEIIDANGGKYMKHNMQEDMQEDMQDMNHADMSGMKNG
ncbi:hypothetical protein GCM10020331_062010 [Ectobacillus funiculus]